MSLQLYLSARAFSSRPRVQLMPQTLTFDLSFADHQRSDDHCFLTYGAALEERTRESTAFGVKDGCKTLIPGLMHAFT